MATKPTTAELNNLLLALTQQVNNLVAANAALTKRLDEADVWCDGLRDYVVAEVEALQAKTAPLRTPATPTSISRSDYLRALNDLRDEAGTAGALFTSVVIKERARVLATMAANRETAAATH